MIQRCLRHALGDLGGLTSLTERWWSQISVDEGGSDYGLRHGAGEGNRTRMTSLQGICAPARAPLGCAFWSDLLAPRGTIIDSGLGPAKGPAWRLLFDLLSSCSGLLKHAAANARPPSPTTVDVQHAAELYAQGWTLRSRCGTDGSPTRWLLLPRRTTPPPSKTAARGAVRSPSAMPRPPYRCYGTRRARRGAA
jgi:hypothetical protein